MGTYKELHEREKAAWLGKRVRYNGEEYTVMDVDYNGGLLIDKKAEFTEWTAIPQKDCEPVETTREFVNERAVRYNVIIDGEWYMAGSFEEASTCAARWEADEEPHSVMIVRSEDDE